MNPLSRIHHKAKPAFLFLLVMLAIVGSSFIEKSLMRNLNTSVSSLYQDRLMPATDLFELNDLMYAKRHLLAAFMADPSADRQHNTQVQLAGRNVEIRSIMAAYQATYLVAEEEQVFQALSARLHAYNALESRLLIDPKPVSVSQKTELARQFAGIHKDLTHLNQIQVRVGQELTQSSEAVESQASLLSNVKIALLVLFTLAIQHALLLDKHPLLPKNLKNFRLN